MQKKSLAPRSPTGKQVLLTFLIASAEHQHYYCLLNSQILKSDIRIRNTAHMFCYHFA